MHTLNSTVRILTLVVCALAFPSAAHASALATTTPYTTDNPAISAVGQIGAFAGDTALLIQGAGGSQPHENITSYQSLSLIISFFTNGMPFAGF